MTICNETICNETICNETICNETICNETICNETICNGYKKIAGSKIAGSQRITNCQRDCIAGFEQRLRFLFSCSRIMNDSIAPVSASQ